MEGDATVEGLLDRVARARAAGQTTDQVVRLAADFLTQQPGGSPAERRDRLAAVVAALAGPGGGAGPAVLQLIAALEAAEPPAPPPALPSEVVRRPVRATGPRAADPDWLWNEPLGVPEAEEVGPPLGDAEFAAWEGRYGVPLPPALKRAYRQQDGGYVRGNDRGVRLNRLHMVEPVEDGYTDYMDDPGGSAEGGRFDPARLFYLGGDDTGANVLLHYGEPAGAGPAVYAHYTDGGSVERLADTADGLCRGAAG